MDVVDQRALLGLLADPPHRLVRVLGGAEDICGTGMAASSPPSVDSLLVGAGVGAAGALTGDWSSASSRTVRMGGPKTTARRGRRHLHRGSSPGQGVQPASDSMTRTPASEGGTASPSRFTQVTWNPRPEHPAHRTGSRRRRRSTGLVAEPLARQPVRRGVRLVRTGLFRGDHHVER